MRNSYDVIEIDNQSFLIHCKNFIFDNNIFFVYQVGLKHAKPNISKIFKTNIILITKYLIVKSFISCQKMIDFK